MQTPTMFAAAARGRSRRSVAIAAARAAATATCVAALAALPASAAQAATASPDGQASPFTVERVPQAQLEALLAQIPLSDLDAAALGETLAKLPGVAALPTGKLEQAGEALVSQLAGGGKTLEALTDPSEVVASLTSKLTSLLDPSELLALLTSLKGESVAEVLTSELESLDVGQLVGALLADAGEPQSALAEVLGAVEGKALETLLGSPLPLEPLAPTTVEGLAGELGMSAEALAEQLGTNTTELPANALALTGALPDGVELSALDGLGGLSLSLETHATEGSEGGGSGGTGGGASPGGSAGSGGASPGQSGAGGDSTSGGVTVVVEPAAEMPAAVAATSRGPAYGAVRIVSHRVRDGVATLVVQTPGAGRLTLGGRGVRATSRRIARAERVTVRVRLARAVRARRGGHHHADVRLTATFAPSGAQPGSSASAVVGYTR